MLYTTLRMLHMLTGIFAGGSYLFLGIILYPALRRAKVPMAPVHRAIPGRMLPIMTVNYVITFGTGTAMTLMLRGGSLATLLKTAWGWAILVGFLTTLAVIIVTLMIMPAGLRMSRLDRMSKERPLTAEETQDLQQCTQRFFSNVESRVMAVPYYSTLVALLS